METTETTQPSLDGLGVSDGFSVSGDTGASGDFVIVTDPAGGSEATINERWYRLYSHSKAMCELMVAFNTELEPGYAPQGLGIAVHDQLAKLENLATAARILITPAIAATGEWKREGAPNPERWFAGKTGKSPAKARAEMETGKNLGEAPGTRKAFLEGELSAEQADTIADAVEANPEAEQALLDAAKEASLKELKDEAARRKAEVEDMEKRERRIHKGRYVRTWTDSGGAWNLHAKGTIPDGADFASVLERLIDQQFKQARKNGVRGTRDNYAFDALMNMAAQHGFGPSDAHGARVGPQPAPGARPAPAAEPGSGRAGDCSEPEGGPKDGPEGDGDGAVRPRPAPAAEPGSGHAGDCSEPEGGPKDGPEGDGDGGVRPQPAGPKSPRGSGPRSASGDREPEPTDDQKRGSLFPGVVDPPEVNGGSHRQSTAGRGSSRPVGKRLTYCIDWDALVRGQTRIGERCELRGSGPVSVSAVRRALGNGSAKLIVTDADDRVVSVAHLGTGPINLRLIPGLLDPTRRDLEGSARPFAEQGNPRSSGGSVGATVIVRVRVGQLGEHDAASVRSIERDRNASCGSEDLIDCELGYGDGETRDRPLEPDLPSAAIPGVGRVSRAHAVAVLGSEVLARLTSRGDAVRGLTYAGRAPNAAQRVALAWADTTCKVRACPNQRVEVDHRLPWAAHRVTELENLDPLCSHHHDLKSNQGWQFVVGTNRFVPPEDPDHPGRRDTSSAVAFDDASGQ